MDRFKIRLEDIEKKSDDIKKMTDEIEKKTVEAVEKITEIETETMERLETMTSEIEIKTEEIKTRTSKGESVETARDALTEPKKRHELLIAKDLLLPLKEKHPTSRTVNMLLGRLHRWLGEFGQAISVLEEFTEKKKEIGEGEDKDVADALFNIACYKAQMAKLVPDISEEDKKALRMEAIDHLERSIALHPENKEDAIEDDDLKPLRGESKFNKLVGIHEWS